MKLRCVDQSFASDHITEGCVYETIDFVFKDDEAFQRVKIIDDNGGVWFPFLDRFVVEEE